MRDFRSARRAGDDVVLAQGIAFVSEAQFTLAFEDEEHLLLAAMIVKRALHLAGRHECEVVAKLLRANVNADRGALRGITAVLLDIVEYGLIEIHHRLHCCPPIRTKSEQ